MAVRIYNKGIYTVACLQGEVDESAAGKMRSELDEKLTSPLAMKNIVFDLSGVSFMDSTGIGMLLGRYKILKAAGKNLYITGVNPRMDRILSTGGIYTIMQKVAIK